MKKIIQLSCLLLAFFTASNVNAQEFGIRAGVNIANVHFDDISEEEEGYIKNKIGFNAGATVEFPIANMISLETGLFASSKGLRIDIPSTDEYGDYRTEVNLNLLYIDIPVVAKANFKINDNVKVYGLIGPYIGFGLTGKTSYLFSGPGINEELDEDVTWGNTEDDLKRLDFGLIGGLGVEVKGIDLRFNYNLGLANMAPDVDNVTQKANHRIFAISAGYKINKK